MSAHVLSNLLNTLRKEDEMRGFAQHLNIFPQQVLNMHFNLGFVFPN